MPEDENEKTTRRLDSGKEISLQAENDEYDSEHVAGVMLENITAQDEQPLPSNESTAPPHRSQRTRRASESFCKSSKLTDPTLHALLTSDVPK